ncbi:Glutathione-dependent formaldehyde-activating GFA [Ketogulonicigenium vulgare WSH-001]|uniref:Glutathione-dependent formaldehyde-activating GFA n=2 Tax=Ketogulonicigenium vulgare TaxID=92945 RepID=F9YA87_KETVW|nr:Glutathione-dependent formaldehyde-activating GFA [Ketogulonicigenium vulgare WSH-001]
MRGAVAVSAKLADLEILEGRDNLSMYQFNTGQAKHYFCKTCGIYTHHQRRSRPGEFGVNLACISKMSPFDLPEVPVLNGRDHPRDGNPHRNPVYGTLIFRRSDS